jgi:hypothetical protein
LKVDLRLLLINQNMNKKIRIRYFNKKSATAWRRKINQIDHNIILLFVLDQYLRDCDIIRLIWDSYHKYFGRHRDDMKRGINPMIIRDLAPMLTPLETKSRHQPRDGSECVGRCRSLGCAWTQIQMGSTKKMDWINGDLAHFRSIPHGFKGAAVQNGEMIDHLTRTRFVNGRFGGGIKRLGYWTPIDYDILNKEM